MTLLQSFHNLLPVTLTALSFVYCFLPLCLIVYYVAPTKLRPLALLMISLAFYALSQPAYFLLIVFSAALDVGLTQCVVVMRRGFWRRTFLWACVVKNLMLIGYFSVVAQLKPVYPPIGLLVAGVSGIDCALAAYREENPQIRNPVRLSLYILFFPRLYAGPLIEPGKFYAQCANIRFDARKAVIGFGYFVEGAFKYVAFGRGLYWLYDSVAAIPATESSVLSAWVFVLSFALSLYFTLSGLAGMAKGIAGMFGLELPQNFYYPYQSRSVSDFFERFNITAGAFLKRAVIGPLAPDRRDPAADAINLVLMGMLWGIWFGLRANYIVWGVFVAFFIILERYAYPNVIKAAPTLFCRCYTFVVTLIGFTIFSGESMLRSMSQLKLMFGIDAGSLFNDRILYALSANWILLLLSCVFSTNVVSLASGFARKSWPRAAWIVIVTADVFVLAAFTALILGGGRL